MLKTLHLTRFGKFRERQFQFEAVTLFHGPNESGKSTLFDALKHALAPSRSHPARYGTKKTDVQVDPVWDDPEQALAFEPGLYENLLTVQGSDWQPRWHSAGKKGTWQDHLKKRLFDGDLDLDQLIKRFGDIAKDDGRSAHQREIRRLIAARSAIQRRLEDRQAQRRALFEGQDANAQLLQNLEQRRTELTQKRQKLRAVQARWQRAELHRRRLQAEDRLAQLAQRESLGQRAGSMDSEERGQAKLKALDALQQKRDASRTQAAKTEASLTDLDQRLLRLSIQEQKQQNAYQEEREQLARLRNVWQRRYQDRPWLEAHAQQVVLGVAGLVLVAVLLLASWTVSIFWWFGMLILLGGLAFWRARHWQERSTLARCRTRWQSDRANSWPLADVARLQDWHTACQEHANRLQNPPAALVQVQSEQRTCRSEQEKAQQQHRTTQDLLRQDRLTVEDWLRKEDLSDRDALIGRQNAAKHLRQQLVALEKGIQTWGKAYRSVSPAGDLAGLRRAVDEEQREAISALKALETSDEPPREGPSSTERTLAEWTHAQQRLQQARDSLQTEIQARQQELSRQERQASEDRGRHLGQLGTLPEDIDALARQKDAITRELDQKYLEQRGAKQAVSIFEALREDQQMQFGSVAKAVSEHYAAAVGLAPGSNHALLSGLDGTNSLRASDQGGVRRVADHLSHGTQQALYLAFRLALARRAYPKRPALLCFDDAFSFLDAVRLAQCLDLLCEHVKATQWQLVVFTADERVAQAVRERFPACANHLLS